MAKNTWVASIVPQLTKNKIQTILELQLAGYNNGGIVKTERLGNAVFGQIIDDNKTKSEKDPTICINESKQKYIYLTSYRDYFKESYDNFYYERIGREYNKEKTEKFSIGEEQIFGKLSEVSGPHEIYNNAFQKFGEAGLAKLLKHGSFNYVNFNLSTGDIFACAGKKLSKRKGYNPVIYYAFLNDNRKDIVMSNNIEIMKILVEKIYRLPENSIMINGEIKSLIPQIEITSEIKKEENETTNGVNIIKSDEISKQIEKFQNTFIGNLERITDNYVDNFDINRILSKQQRTNFIKDVKKEILNIIRDDLTSRNVVDIAVEQFEKLLQSTIKTKINEYMSTIYIPQVNIINERVKSHKKIEGIFHTKFSEILSTVDIDEPVMLIGPAGSGKNVVIGQVADALNLPMYYTNNANNEFKLLGYMDAAGHYHETPFYTAFTKGGVFFLDEIDASDPSALIVINSGIANGYMFFPNSTKPVQMHPNFKIIAAANTWGRGADLQYVGRSSLDGSTLDRFDTIFFNYDEKMESILYPDKEVLEFMWNFRNAVFETRMPHIVSTRGIKKVYTKKINEFPIETAIYQNIAKGLSKDNLSILIGKLTEMKTLSDDNRYYEEVKKLVLK